MCVRVHLFPGVWWVASNFPYMFMKFRYGIRSYMNKCSQKNDSRHDASPFITTNHNFPFHRVDSKTYSC